MPGQGRPQPSRESLALRTGKFDRNLLRLLLIWLMLCAGVAHGVEPTLRVRIAWGGGQEKLWRGRVSLSVGTLGDPVLLGSEADAPGSMWVQENHLEIHPRGPRAYDGVDISLYAPLSAKLKIDLTSRASDATKPNETAKPLDIPKVIEIPLSELLRDGHANLLDDQGNRLLIRRAPGDALRLKLGRDSLVFAPNEDWPLEVQPQLPQLNAGTTIHVKGTLTPARGGKTLWSKEVELKLGSVEQPATLTLPLTMPLEEGAYELSLEATERGLLRWNKPLADRKVQFVVVDGKSPANGNTKTPWATVMELDPASPKSWTSLTALNGGRKSPLGSGHTATWTHALGTLVQLAPAPRNGEPTWEAYSLAITKLGQPHLVEIDLPSDVAQTLGVSLLEPNAAGAVVPMQLDTGVEISDEAVPRTPHWLRHRVLFWPRTKNPMLLVTNRRDTSRAVYGKIRVLAGPSHLPRLLPEGNETAVRGWGSYLHKPLFNENFGVSDALDTWSGRSLDDWQSFYEGTTRLMEYLNYSGQNSLLITVAGDGSALYPSKLLEPSTRYDNGRLFDQGHDPVHKDSLELLLRLCDREGIRCLPALQFSAPLPELEALLRAGGAETAGLRWVGADGQSHTERHNPREGLAPYYNILHPRVQDAILHVARETLTRYAQHPAFAGLAIELGSDGYAVLPGDQWGFDDETIARFSLDTKLTVPGEGSERFAARANLLLGAQRQVWVEWRARQLAAFYKKLAHEVQAANGSAKLHLCAVNVLAAPEIQRSVRPMLPNRAKHGDLLVQLGIHPELFRDAPSIVLPRPQRLSPGAAFAPQGADVEFNRSLDVDRQYAGGHPATLLYHEPQRNRLSVFDAKNPFGKGKSNTRQTVSIAPAEPLVRQRFVHALATLDALDIFDGGWLLPLGQEAGLRDFVQTYRRLPARKFDALAESSQPVAIRSLSQDGKTYIYLANDSPWDTTLRLQVDMPSGCRIDDLSGNKKLAAISGTAWTIELGPYELAAAVFSSPQVKFSRPQVRLSGGVEGSLEQRIRDLSNRAAALAHPNAWPALSNPSFDLPEVNNKIPSWDCNRPAALKLERPGGTATGSALKVRGAGGLTTVRSDLFEPPPSGRISVAVQLKIEQVERQPQLRLALEGQHEGRPYYRAAIVGAGQDTIRVGVDFSPYIFQVDDLPAGLTQLRVRFDLLDESEVWFDDVQLYDLAFSETERVELTKIIASASIALHAGKVGDCQRVLDGYWPRYLTQNVPLVQLAAPLRQPEHTAERPEPAVEKKKKWWPF